MSTEWRINADGDVTPPPGEEGWTRALDGAVSAWRDGKPILRTSGSTDTPKEYRFTAQAVTASANDTARHFGLDGRSVSAWSALPATGTGGRMMVWRALILGWNLSVAAPSARPRPETGGDGLPHDFAVATPMQMAHVLDVGALASSRQWLLGGAPIPRGLEARLADAAAASGCTIHHGFGMTETLTHIATRALGSDLYRTLPGIAIFVDGTGALIVEAPGRGISRLQTQDAVELVETGAGRGFKWLGRLDDVINSGGLKVHPAVLERAWSIPLAELMGPRRWYIAGREDGTLGQRISVIVEGDRDEALAESVLETLSGEGNRRPRTVEFRSAFAMTDTGKVRRI